MMALITSYCGLIQASFQLDDPLSKFLPEFSDMRVWVSGEGDAMVRHQRDGTPVD